MEIACLIFNISIEIYKDNESNKFLRFSYSENFIQDPELVLFNCMNNQLFNLLYDKTIELNRKEKKIANLSISIKNNKTKDIIRYEGKKFSRYYVLTK